MRKTRGPAIAGFACAVLTLGCLGGCAKPAPAPAHQPPPAKIQRIGNSVRIVLTPLGRQRIGIQTAAAKLVGSKIMIPFSALLYEPDGQTAVYAATGLLTFTRQLVTVASIAGNEVFLSQGLAAGAQVVTVGAEELLGVQNGVGVET